jgi:hypothetical protein
VSSVGYELVFYIPEDDVLQSDRSERLKCDIMVACSQYLLHLHFEVRKVTQGRVGN